MTGHEIPMSVLIPSGLLDRTRIHFKFLTITAAADHFVGIWFRPAARVPRVRLFVHMAADPVTSTQRTIALDKANAVALGFAE